MSLNAGKRGHSVQNIRIKEKFDTNKIDWVTGKNEFGCRQKLIGEKREWESPLEKLLFPFALRKLSQKRYLRR